MNATATALLTVPEAATRLTLPLDWLRLRIRRHEADLASRGLLVRAGRHRLVAAERLEELRAVLTAK